MIILLTGPDTFRSQRRFVQLRDAFKSKHDQSGISTVILDATEANAEAIRGAVVTQGFFSNKRFVGLNHYSSTAACPPADLQNILKPFAASEEVIVVIREVPVEKSAAAKRTGRGKPAAVSLKLPKAKAEPFPILSEGELQTWILIEAKTQGGSINLAAAKLLLQWCGQDMWRLHNELDKLLSHANGAMITPEDVKSLVRAPEVSDVFGLVDAVAQRRQSDALKLLAQELRAGTHPLALVTLLANHMSVLMNIQRLPNNTSPMQAAKTLGIHPYVATKAMQQSKKFPREQLMRWHHSLVEADERIKSSSVEAEALLNLLFVQS